MSHRGYFFRIMLEDLPEQPIPEKLLQDGSAAVPDELPTDEELLRSAESTFDWLYRDDYCDDNNWYGLLALVLHDRVILYHDYDSPPAKSSPYADVTWDSTCNEVLWSLYGSTRWYTDLDLELTGTPEENARCLRKFLAELLSDIYSAEAKDIECPRLLHGSSWARADLSNNYEGLVNSPNLPGFSSNLRVPYEYHAFDLADAGGLDEGQEAILIVDIHT